MTYSGLTPYANTGAMFKRGDARITSKLSGAGEELEFVSGSNYFPKDYFTHSIYRGDNFEQMC